MCPKIERTMAGETKSASHLKARVYRVTKAYVCVFGFILACANLQGLHWSWDISAVTIPAWISAATTVLATCAVAFLGALPSDHLKAVLVFWRWKDPLPGSRAFEKANLRADPRISIEGLRAHLDGEFPRNGRKQNVVWYQLYRSVQSESAVAQAHYEYLLFRDLTWFTVVLAVIALISLVVNREHWHELLVYTLAASALFALLARAASVRGTRFVRTVLAVVAAQPVETKAKAQHQ